MRIVQLVHTLNYGDAISGEAIAIKSLVEESCLKAEIFTVHAHEKVKEFRRSWEGCKAYIEESAKTEQVVVVLHYSIASPLNQLYAELPESVVRVLIYHNLTPEKWYLSYNARVVADLRVGRSELAPLCELSDLVLGDSSYNAEELKEYGCKDALVLPLLLDTVKWSIPSNPGIAAALKGHGGVNFLHVGRFAPNKCIEDIIKAFYFYHHKINKESRLWLVGSDIDTEIYSFELRQLVSELRLKEAVEFVGALADSELKAMYENADCYLCMSEHEGFCVPLLEAMYFNVPVIAFDACAVAETLGGAGVLIKEKAPALTAELIDEIVSDRQFKAKLVEQGQKRVAEFSREKFCRDFFKAVVEFAEKRVFQPIGVASNAN